MMDLWRFLRGLLLFVLLAFVGGLMIGACRVGARLVMRLVE